MSVSSDNGFVYYLPLVRDRETALAGKIAKLLMGELH